MLSIVETLRGAVSWLELPQLRTQQQVIHFSPANGIPCASYRGFLSNFHESFHVSGMDSRGAWPDQGPPDSSFTWQEHADDLIAAIESQYSQPIIGMGHSLGGTITVLAAEKRPELFSRLILIDPATSSHRLSGRVFNSIPQWLSFRLFPFISRTHQRRRIWANREEFYNNYRNHPTYKNFTDQALNDYSEFGLKKRSEGDFELIYNPAWESHNFRKIGYLWDSLQNCRLPCLLLKAEHSNIYKQSQFDKRTANLGYNITPQIIPESNHLVTHESPRSLSQQILKWL